MRGHLIDDNSKRSNSRYSPVRSMFPGLLSEVSQAERQHPQTMSDVEVATSSQLRRPNTHLDTRCLQTESRLSQAVD